MVIGWKGLLTKFKWLIVGIVAVVFALIAYGCYRDKSQPVTGMSQQQAETVQGVKLAADNADVPMLKNQLEEARAEIARLKNQPPEVIVKTKTEYVQVEVEKGVKQSGADFAILTNPTEPDKPVKVDELPPNADVILNQYNVHVYKSLIRQIEIAPDWAQLAEGKFKVDTVGIGVAKKISKSGKYLGVKAQYDFDDEKGRVLAQYMY